MIVLGYVLITVGGWDLKIASSKGLICCFTSSSVTVRSTASKIICCWDTVSNSTSSLKERVIFEPLSTSCLILNTVVVGVVVVIVKFSTYVFLNSSDI